MKHRLTLEECMNIFDWFEDSSYEYINHILLSKLDGEKRIRRAMPKIRKRARWLLRVYAGTSAAYPEQLLNIPA